MTAFQTVVLGDFLKLYRIEHRVQDELTYKQVTISKTKGISFRGIKKGKDIGRKRQFKIDLDSYPNTLMFTRQGIFDGSIGIAPIEVNKCIVTENMPMMTIDTDIVEIDYLKKLLISKYLFKKIKNLKIVGSAQKSIHERDLLKITIKLPSKNDQIKMCKIFSSLDVYHSELLLEFNNQQTILKKLRQQILQEAIEGKLTKEWRLQNPDTEPASELLKRIQAEKELLLKENKIKKQKELPVILEKEKSFKLPSNWKWTRLQDLSKLITDGKHGDCQNLQNSGYYFLSAKDIQNKNLIYENARQIVPDEFQEVHNRTDLEAGDICMVNTGATVGKLAIAPDHPFTKKTTFQKSVAVLKVIKPNVNQEFIGLFLNCQTTNLLSKSKGGAINNLLLGDLKCFLVPLPPILEQHKIVKKVDKLFAICDELEAQIDSSQTNAKELMKAVLKEAFTQEDKVA